MEKGETGKSKSSQLDHTAPDASGCFERLLKQYFAKFVFGEQMAASEEHQRAHHPELPAPISRPENQNYRVFSI